MYTHFPPGSFAKCLRDIVVKMGQTEEKIKVDPENDGSKTKTFHSSDVVQICLHSEKDIGDDYA